VVAVLEVDGAGQQRAVAGATMARLGVMAEMGAKVWRMEWLR
jgi:hypothetical protein